MALTKCYQVWTRPRLSASQLWNPALLSPGSGQAGVHQLQVPGDHQLPARVRGEGGQPGHQDLSG